MSHDVWTRRQPGLHAALLSRVQLALRERDECGFYYAISACASDYARPIVEARHQTLFSLTTQDTARHLISLVLGDCQAAIRCAGDLLAARFESIDEFKIVMELLAEEHDGVRDAISHLLVWSNVWYCAPRCAALAVAHPGLDITVRCYEKRTMLMYALWFNNNAAISTLLERGGNDFSETCRSGHDTLWYALNSTGAYVPYEHQRWYGLERIAPLVDDYSVLASYERIAKDMARERAWPSYRWPMYYEPEKRLRAEIEIRRRWNALRGHWHSVHAQQVSRRNVARILVLISARGFGRATLSL